jgi:hypothetical protein
MQARRALPLSAPLVVVVGLVFVGACNVLNGSGDLNFGEVPGSGPLADDAASSTGNDGGGTTSDGGGFIADAGVNPKVSSCGMNLVCLPDVGGWSPALFLVGGGGGTSGGGCPVDYPQRNDMRQSGGGRCNCTCSANGGSCAGSVDSKSGPACSAAPSNLAVTAGQCTTLTAVLPVPVAFTAHPSGPTPTSCGATVAPKLGTPRPATFCTGAVPSAGTCDPGELCVRKPTTPSTGLACIVHDGDIACPNSLGFRTLVGTAITDGRSCSDCSCQPAPCGGTIEAFSDNSCATSVRSVSVDGTCTTSGAAISGNSYRYTPSLGCGENVPAKVLGSETFTGERTLCCSF